jgi:hypothetical protein
MKLVELGRASVETKQPINGPQDGVDTFGPNALI